MLLVSPRTCTVSLALADLEIQGCMWPIHSWRNSLSRGIPAKPLPWSRWENVGEKVCTGVQACIQCHGYPGAPLCKSLGWVQGFLRWQWTGFCTWNFTGFMNLFLCLTSWARCTDESCSLSKGLGSALSQPQPQGGVSGGEHPAGPCCCFPEVQRARASGSMSTQWLVFKVGRTWVLGRAGCIGPQGHCLGCLSLAFGDTYRSPLMTSYMMWLM